jgi:hypothetical protein
VPALVAAVFLLWFSAALAGVVPEPPLPVAGLGRLGQRLLGRPGIRSQFAFGVVNGFLPCGLVYSALAIPVSLGSASSGALAMIAFGAGTIPLLSAAAILLRRYMAGSLARRRLLALVILLLGLAAIAMRTGVAGPSHMHHEEPGHQMTD